MGITRIITFVKDKGNLFSYNIWSCGGYLNNVTGFNTSHSNIELNSDYVTLGDTCLHVIHLPESQGFESISINKPSSLIAGNGYQITFDVYYPTANDYDLNVRFYQSSSSHNDVTVSGSDNIQSITITNDDFYRLEMFTRENVAQTEYWVSNMRCTLL